MLGPAAVTPWQVKSPVVRAFFLVIVGGSDRKKDGVD